MIGYQEAIDCTARAIERRARYFRNQVVTVVVIVLFAVAWALAAASLLPLIAAVLLIPACGIFLIADSRLLDGWRATVLASWARRDLDIGPLREAIRANPVLPRETMEAMLVTLPSTLDVAAEQRISVATRKAIAAATLAMYATHSDALGVKTLASTVIVAALVVAVLTRRWEPLATLASLAAMPAALSAMRHRRRHCCEREVDLCRIQRDFSESR